MQERGIVKAVSSQELRFAMAIFENAAAMKTPRPNVENRRVVVEDENGSATLYRLGDHILTRGLTAIMDHYKEQKVPEEDRYAIGLRLLCVPDVVRHPACAKWMRKTEATIELDDAVIDTLATFPMRYEVDVNWEDFFQQVELTANPKAA